MRASPLGCCIVLFVRALRDVCIPPRRRRRSASRTLRLTSAAVAWDAFALTGVRVAAWLAVHRPHRTYPRCPYCALG